MSDQQSPPVCYRHRNRQTYLRCVRCDKPICADCRIDAPVGFQCPDCVAEGRRTMRRTRTAFGGRASAFGGSSSGSAGTVTKAMIGINVAVFVLTLAVGGAAAMGFSITEFHLALAQFSRPATAQVDLFGNRFLLPTVAAGGEYRLLTSTFMHFGAMHLLFNMVVLWILGRVLERDLGSMRFLAVYLLSGLAGSVVTYLFASPEGWSAGASGAIYGMFGALILVNRRLSRDNTGLYVLLGLNLALTFIVPAISITGHLGGLVGGLLCGAVLAFTPKNQRRVLHWVGFAAILVLLIVLTMWRTGVLVSQYGIG
ncbi:rhomboid family intramembrane serine protease [Glycomyces sp. L485]|uniref:rhomboid family intramembrane serine protease n=1 Tax=Glycomyces sp. L485 TaxID=2909235 RepID=UPI001F4ADE80|nr:rhomboid family intramembrane serine protease [Glycomyces sp. L485]MCH7229548.1 rhomboid family intramembrane serine protease [Glycomyces sp. L485]